MDAGFGDDASAPAAPLEIVLYPDPVLTRAAAPMDPADLSDPDVRARVDAMFEAMYRVNGVGLAGPQVGWSVRLAVLDCGEPHGRLVIVNPELTAGEGWVTEEEGCLSFPGIGGRVRRRETVTCRFTDMDGEEREITSDGLLSRAFQHEVDHLDGILFVTRFTPAERQAAKPRLRELEAAWNEGGGGADRA